MDMVSPLASLAGWVLRQLRAAFLRVILPGKSTTSRRISGGACADSRGWRSFPSNGMSPAGDVS